MDLDADYCFAHYAVVGCQTRISDGGVFRNSTLFKKLNENQLNLQLINHCLERKHFRVCRG